MLQTLELVDKTVDDARSAVSSKFLEDYGASSGLQLASLAPNCSDLPIQSYVSKFDIVPSQTQGCACFDGCGAFAVHQISISMLIVSHAPPSTLMLRPF